MKIAISYRRADSQDITGRIFDRLVQRFGRQAIFRDIDSIRPGIDFREQIEETLQKTDVLLAIVGPKWLGRGRGAEARIDNEADLVRIEVATALKRNIPVVPVLVGGTKMPTTRQLPDDLKPFAFRHAIAIDSGRDFDHHVDGLIRALDGFSSAAGNARPADQTRQRIETGTAKIPRYALSGGLGGIAVLLLAATLIGLGRIGVPVWKPAAPASEQRPVPRAEIDAAEAKRKADADAAALSKQKADEAAATRSLASAGDSVSGTTWQGKNSMGKPITFTFAPNGVFSGMSRGTWTQTGDAIHIDVNNKYAQYEGIIRGDRMEGRAWNIRNFNWTWWVEKQ